jgi:LacI family transcriptional regulator
VPQDISIVGLDDIEVAAFQTPPLTTVRQSFTQMARLGVELLFNVLAGTPPAQPHVVLEPVLIVRQSTAPPCRRAR